MRIATASEATTDSEQKVVRLTNTCSYLFHDSDLTGHEAMEVASSLLLKCVTMTHGDEEGFCRDLEAVFYRHFGASQPAPAPDGGLQPAPSMELEAMAERYRVAIMECVDVFRRNQIDHDDGIQIACFLAYLSAKLSVEAIELDPLVNELKDVVSKHMKAQPPKT